MRRVFISILARVKGNVNANAPTGAALTEIKKFFTTEGETRVYVSGRCVKYCIKQQLAKKGNQLSKLSRVQRVLRSEGNPISFVDDDLFGYLIPEEERKRFAPIKTDGIVALKHCEITRDFAGRFDPEDKEYPSPFEIEVADFVGRNNWIITDKIGKFRENEIKKEMVKSLKLKEEFYHLPPKEKRKRLKDFFDVLLKERYTFPRSAVGLHQPEYYYAFILLSERQLPLFSFVDYESKGGKILPNHKKLEDFTTFLDKEEKIIIVDYENMGEKFNAPKIEIRTVRDLDKVIDTITTYLLQEEAE
jgi:CRISPR-associated autoregulator DevR family